MRINNLLYALCLIAICLSTGCGHASHGDENPKAPLNQVAVPESFEEAQDLLQESSQLEGIEPLKSVIAEYPEFIKQSNSQGRTLLHTAAASGQIEAIKYLVGKGADLEARDIGGRTPLIVSAYEPVEELAILLIDLGADPKNRTLNPYTGEEKASPLDIAACRGHVELAKLLLEKGSPIFDESDSHKRSSLHYACRGHMALQYKNDLECKGNRKMIDLLVDHLGEGGINIVYTPQKGYEMRYTPLSTAYKWKAEDTIEYIKEAYPEISTFDRHAVPESEINGHLKRATVPEDDAADD